MRKEKKQNVADWFMMKKIDQGIHLKTNQIVKVLEVKPINFKLLSDFEQEKRLSDYERFIKQCDIDIQMLVVPYPLDVKEHLSDIQKYGSENEKIASMTERYIQFVSTKIGEKNRFTRKFFMILTANEEIEEHLMTIINGLNACGNEVTICEDEKIEELLRVIFQKPYHPNMLKNQDDLYPTYLSFQNPCYVMIDQFYVASLFVQQYHSEMEGGFLDKIIASDVPFLLSMFYERKSTYETIKQLTGIIGNTGANIKVSGSNQMDIDLMKGTYENAKYIKKQLQVEDDVLFDLNIYFLVYAESLEELKTNVRKLESLALGCGLSTRQGIYRQEELLQACLPFHYQAKEIKHISKRNVLATGLVSTYPYLSNELCDKNGVFIGENALNHSVVMVDRFDSEKYKNANMCVIGASGSGKSYFMKLMIIRNRLLNVTQFVIDPDREYTKMCQELDGTMIRFGETNHINILEIREIPLEEGETFLQNKIQKLMTFFSLVFSDMKEEEKSILEEKIIECYAQKGITFDNTSLYWGEVKGKLVSKNLFKSGSDMPVLGDLYKIISKDKSMTRLAKLLKPYVSGSLRFMNGITNVDTNNKLIVVDIYQIEEKYLPMALLTITEFFWDRIQENRGRKKIIYLDEVWKLINKNQETADFVFKIFKTIRKYGGAATAVTQDINDFFSLEDGAYGKGILSNSSIKCIFQTEENDVKKLQEVVLLSELEMNRILAMERGMCVMHAGRNHMLVKVLASEFEHPFISTDRKDW